MFLKCDCLAAPPAGRKSAISSAIRARTAAELPDAMREFTASVWNAAILERLVLLMPQGLIKLEDILAQVRIDASLSPTGASATLREARTRFEREYIAEVLHKHHGRMPATAQTLGIQRSNLYRTIRRLKLDQA